MGYERRKTSPIYTMPSEEFKALVGRSGSIGEVLRHFGLQNHGGTSAKVRIRAAMEGIELPRGSPGAASRARMIPLADVLVEHSTYKRGNLKRRIIEDGLVEYVCAVCGRDPEWQGEPLVLILDHINGANDDHRIENLRFVCPNCDSQLPTFSGRNARRRLN